MFFVIGKLLIYFVVGKNVLLKLFNEFSLNCFIIVDYFFLVIFNEICDLIGLVCSCFVLYG